MAVLFVTISAVLAAGAVTFFVVAHSHPVERYRDLVVGSVSWTDSSKSSDFTYLYLFVALLAVFTFALAAAVRFFLRRAPLWAKAAACGGLLFCLGGVLLWVSTVWFLGFCVICYACVAWQRQEFLRDRQLWFAGVGLTIGGMAFFAGLGLAAVPGRLLGPLPGIHLWPLPWLADQLPAADIGHGFQLALLALPLLCVFAAASFVVLSLGLARAIHDLRRRLEMAVFVAQILLPLCFLIFLPAHLLAPDGVLTLDSTIYLRILLLALMAGAWWGLWRAYGKWKTSAQESHTLDASLSTLCLAAPAVYFSMFYERSPYLNGDHFHIGELLLPWQQLLHFHSIPYVNFAPIHGLMSYAYGFISSAFLDGTAASFIESQRILFGIAVLVTVWAARPLCGCLLAAACAIPMALPNVLDRDLFLAAAIFLLVNPETLRRPAKWLLTCIGVCAFSLGFNVPVGGALVVACSIPFGYLLVGWIRSHRKIRIWPVALAAGIGALILVGLFPVLRGWVRFATDNGSANMAANGTRFQESLTTFPSSGGFLDLLKSTEFLTPFLRESWVLAGIYGLCLLVIQVWKPKQERSPSILLGAWFLLVVPLVLSFYTFVRIEGTGISRSGPISIIVLATILPVLNFRILPPCKPILLLFVGYAFVAFMLPGQLQADLTYVRFKSATLLTPTSYPPGQVLTRGPDVGLPAIGRLSADAPTTNEIRALKHALSMLLRPDETYADLTNRQAFYYYLDLPVPQLYVEYVASSEKMQERMIQQWRADPSPVVLIAPAEVFDGGLPSLRCYRWYRELLSAYTPIVIDGFTFLVGPKRLPDNALTASKRSAILDSVFFAADLRALPSAWGRSWSLLKPRFKKVADVPVEPDATPDAAVTRSATFNLEPLNLTGADADFATVDFVLGKEPALGPAQADPTVTISWTSVGEKQPPKQSFLAKSATVLLPLGSQPRWLLSDKLQTLRLDLVNPGSVTVFGVKGLTLWKLNDLPNESAPRYPTSFRFNRPRSWALWPSSAAQGELSKAILELKRNITFDLASNVVTAAYNPTWIKTPEGSDAVFAHAPAKLFEDVSAQKQSLSFGFGILPDAYTSGGRTSGVLFEIWLETGGVRTLVWSRLLNPLEQPQDRGTQLAKISLDPPKGARLIFETSPNGSNVRDWSYWADVRIE
jgi:hypothetical protein